MKRTLKLRPYQEPASDFAMERPISVLGMAPNGGKTEVAFDVINRYFQLHPKARVLVLAHSTNVLKSNFSDRLSSLDVRYKHSDDFDPAAQVHITIPQSEHKFEDKYDLLIVDEAHENYFASRVQRIINNIKPKKQVLLTGTPSKFVKRDEFKGKIFVLAANEIPDEYFAKLSVEIVVSNYNWAKDLNDDYEVRSDYKFKRQDTEATMESVVLKLMQRFKAGLTAEQFNGVDLDETTTNKVTGKIKLGISTWGPLFNKLKKTIMVCRSIHQADDVGEILGKHGVNYAVSHSVVDPDSQEVANFKKGNTKVLVVVDRGRLGYSDDGLFNIVDLSGTHNPNMIYQIFARVLRGDPSMQKFYMKVTTNESGMKDFTTACVCAALMLTDRKYLSTFNGNNFKGLLVPVMKKRKITPPVEGDDSDSDPSPSPIKKTFVYPEFTHDVIDLFRFVTGNLGEGPASIYKLVTLSEVRAGLSGRVFYTEEDIFASARGEINLSK